MPKRYAKLVAFAGFAALGMWLTSRNKRHKVNRPGPEIDDDAAAEIIRRALPSLERARALAVAR
jgi:hypothetical protein